MRRLRILWRTTAFRLMLAYLAVFLVFAFSLVGWMAYNTSKLIQDQIVETVDSELRNLADIYRNGGTRRLIAAIDQRSRQPGSSVYLVTNLAGESIVGNIANIQPGTLDREGWRETSYTHSNDDANEERHKALVRVVQLPARSACWWAVVLMSVTGCARSCCAVFDYRCSSPSPSALSVRLL